MVYKIKFEISKEFLEKSDIRDINISQLYLNEIESLYPIRIPEINEIVILNEHKFYVKNISHDIKLDTYTYIISLKSEKSKGLTLDDLFLNS